MGAPTRYDWDEIQRFFDLGNGFVECQKRFGFSHTAWVKAIKTGKICGHPARFADRRRKYDWAAIQRYYDEGHTYRECREKFGFESMSWFKARRRGEIMSRPLGKPLEAVLADARNGTHVKNRLLRAGLIENCCSACGLREWRGKPLTIQIDHINGVKSDHRLENLRMLCPNCHSQTETFGTKNWRFNRPSGRSKDRGERADSSPIPATSECDSPT